MLNLTTLTKLSLSKTVSKISLKPRIKIFNFKQKGNTFHFFSTKIGNSEKGSQFSPEIEEPLTNLFLLIILFFCLYVHTNAIILIMFLFIYEFLATLPVFLNKKAVYAIISMKFATSGLSCFIYPNFFMTAESYAFSALLSIIILALREDLVEKRSLILKLHYFFKVLQLPCLSESQVYTWTTWLGALSPAFKKVGLVGSAGGGLGTALYLFTENNRKSHETQIRIIAEQSKLIQDHSSHTILLKTEGAISHSEANSILRTNNQELARLKIEAANIKTLADAPGAIIEKFLP
jgi:hypothetical protein